MGGSDIIGRVFGGLTVLGLQELRKSLGGGRHYYYRCRCVCGGETAVERGNLVSGHTRSCGCLSRATTAARNTTHGKSGTPEYRAWHYMRKRCDNPAVAHYDRYGGRGIRYAPEWNDFERFLADVGPRPSPEHSLDRINPNGNYEPGNVRWATKAQQANNASNNVRLTHLGRTQTQAEWARELGVPTYLICFRLTRLGWSVERALSEPPRPMRKRQA